MRVAVVVAKYTEDVSWTSLLPPEWDVIVYDKSDGSLPNVGREAETFARFVVEQYDTLAQWDHIVFLQGEPFDHVAPAHMPTRDEDLRDLVGVAGLGVSYVSDALGKPHHEGLPVQRAHELVFGEENVPPRWQFFAGAQYVVPVPYILGRDRAFWERLHDLLASERVCAWSMERLWPYAFRPAGQWGWPLQTFRRAA